jgi:hypothetical protein
MVDALLLCGVQLHFSSVTHTGSWPDTLQIWQDLCNVTRYSTL